MHMLRSKYILFTIFLLSVANVSAQKAERDYIRKGNRLFNDSVFVDAEVNYRKALEVNPKSTVSMYNLGNTLSQQQKFQDAMEQYVAAGKIEKDKMKLAHIYHNMGVLFQAGNIVATIKLKKPSTPAQEKLYTIEYNHGPILNCSAYDAKNTTPDTTYTQLKNKCLRSACYIGC